MGARWRQENHYRYARIHFDLDSHDTYRAGDDDPTRMVPNPAKKPAYQQVEKARRALHLAETARDPHCWRALAATGDLGTWSPTR